MRTEADPEAAAAVGALLARRCSITHCSAMNIELALAAIRAARLGEADPDSAGLLKRGDEVWRTFRLQSTGWLVYVTVWNEGGIERYEVSKRRPWPL